MLGLPSEFLAQLGILCGNAHRAGIQVAFAQHDAPHRNQRRGGESEFFGSEQRGNDDVATGLQLAVGLHANAAAQVVHEQDLLGFGESKLPRNSGVLDGTQR